MFEEYNSQDREHYNSYLRYTEEHRVSNPAQSGSSALQDGTGDIGSDTAVSDEGIKYSTSFSDIAQRKRDILIDAYNTLAGQAIEVGDKNTYRQMMGRMYVQLSRYRNRNNVKLNTPLGIVRLLASDVGSSIFEDVRMHNTEVPVGSMDDGSPLMMNARIQSEYNAWSNAITTDAVTGRNLAAVMGNIADVVLKHFTDEGIFNNTEESGQQFAAWFFNYMTHSDARLRAASKAYASTFTDAVRESDNANLKALWEAVEHRRSQLVEWVEADSVKRIDAYIVSKANRKANPNNNWHDRIRSFLGAFVDRSSHALQKAVLQRP